MTQSYLLLKVFCVMFCLRKKNKVGLLHQLRKNGWSLNCWNWKSLYKVYIVHFLHVYNRLGRSVVVLKLFCRISILYPLLTLLNINKIKNYEYEKSGWKKIFLVICLSFKPRIHWDTMIRMHSLEHKHYFFIFNTCNFKKFH